ncbi:hypothetical protein BT96DRAFT_921993 [Gymnopus androsaceus JB14]|uniref:Nuclear condensin complex subunit 3 C-terminal domain-containing protein n=1 Tax=Gymnopus androsaceus JB14 TaxID=1447944 RepID=A0A6A4HE95_9AGAR|nr:hypothetical protein BT96DRAFT_921993 [Gymnopus androsaceus JB14]
MPGRTAAPRKRPSNADALQDLFTQISAIFDQVQNSAANHQKNVVALHKIYKSNFEEAIYFILLRLLESKKGAPGDRVVRYVAAFVKHLNDKSGVDPIDEDDIEDDVAYPPAARFTERLVCKLLVKGFAAKEKLVRYRAVQLCAELVFNLGEIEDKIYYDLRDKLLDRLNDKETSIRSQASIALCKFYGLDDPEELEERDLESLSEVLLESLAYDPQPEVRKAILMNLPINKETIPHILERSRDVDTSIRKMVYNVLEKNVASGEDETRTMGMTHPRALSIVQREMIVRNGLGDLAAKLIEKWVETADIRDQRADGGVEPPQEDSDDLGLLGLLKMFDLRTDKIVADALIRIFESNPDIMDGIAFTDAYWSSLSPETAFLARTCVEFCENHKEKASWAARLDTILPVVTSFAFGLQAKFNDLVDSIRSFDEENLFDLDDEARAKHQDELDDKEFVVTEMLKIANSLDYGDEIGRRKMNSLVRDMLVHDYLPEELVAPSMEVLSRLADSERDLIRVVAIEVIQALRDPGDDEDDDPDMSLDSTPNSTPAKPKKAPKTREEMSDAERKHADKIDRRCLCICESMLERVNGTLENNSSLDGIVKELIYPAVQRKDGDSREQGFRCLGLISLISKQIASGALAFFIKQMKIEQNPEELRPDSWIALFTELLEREEPSEDVRAVLCMGLAKLALPGVLVDKKIVELLLKDYFGPRNADNQKLKQCLSFFFQAYCASSVENQKMISSIFVPIYCDLCKISAELEDDEEMATMAQIVGMILDWTSPNTLFDKEHASDSYLHFDIARDIVKELLNKDSELLKDHKKVLVQHLSKLSLPENADEAAVRYLNLLMDKVPSLHSRRKYEKQLEGLTAEEYMSHEKHQEEAHFLNEILPLDDDLVPPVKRGRKRRSGSITSSAAGEGETKRTSRKGKAKRARLSTSDDDDSDDVAGGDDGTEQGTPPAPSRRSAPTRTMPKRQATRKPVVDIINISSDSDEGDEDEDTPRDTRPRPSKAEDEEDEQLSYASVGHDEGDSEEEDEVSGLLAED